MILTGLFLWSAFRVYSHERDAYQGGPIPSRAALNAMQQASSSSTDGIESASRCAATELTWKTSPCESIANRCPTASARYGVVV